MDVAILLALIALNALFAMAEVALLTAKRSKLQRMVDSGDRQAAAALELGEDPNRWPGTPDQPRYGESQAKLARH